MKRTNFDLKNLQNLTSNYQTKVEQLQNDLASATITAKLSNESMAKLNSEFNSLTTDFNKTKNQAQNKEKLFLVELRKKEKEIGKIKSHLNLQLKGAYKQFDVNSFFMDPSVTNFTNSTGPALGNNELWREMVQRMEEKLQNNQISFSNLKGVLNNVYYSLGALAGINQEELLQPVEVILISFQSIIEKIKTILFANASLSPQKDIQQEMKIMQLERHNVELQNSLREVECQLENNKKLLQMSLTNETCTLDQERSEMNGIRNELDIRSKRLEEDRKKLAELTIKFAQEKQLFLKEKFAFEQQKKSL